MSSEIEETETRRELAGRAEIEELVDAFYEKVQEDEMLGFIFTDVAKTNWETHLPKMYGFWETVLFGTGGFTGNPLAAHAKLVPLTEMGRAQFDRWLAVFEETVDGLFVGEKAGAYQALCGGHGERDPREDQRGGAGAV